MRIESFHIPDVLLISPVVFCDERGLFFESFSVERYVSRGFSPIVQDNMSYSKKNVLRGLHFQKQFPQGKLVSILQGRVYDVIVDLRQKSPTFGQHMGMWLDATACQQLYVPPGCAHGFYVVSEDALCHYKCTEYYHPEDEAGLLWNDPALGIEWPLIDAPILSTKDQQYALFDHTIGTSIS